MQFALIFLSISVSVIAGYRGYSVQPQQRASRFKYQPRLQPTTNQRRVPSWHGRTSLGRPVIGISSDGRPITDQRGSPGFQRRTSRGRSVVGFTRGARVITSQRQIFRQRTSPRRAPNPRRIPDLRRFPRFPGDSLPSASSGDSISFENEIGSHSAQDGASLSSEQQQAFIPRNRFFRDSPESASSGDSISLENGFGSISAQNDGSLASSSDEDQVFVGGRTNGRNRQTFGNNSPQSASSGDSISFENGFGSHSDQNDGSGASSEQTQIFRQTNNARRNTRIFRQNSPESSSSGDSISFENQPGSYSVSASSEWGASEEAELRRMITAIRRRKPSRVIFKHGSSSSESASDEQNVAQRVSATRFNSRGSRRTNSRGSRRTNSRGSRPTNSRSPFVKANQYGPSPNPRGRRNFKPVDISFYF